MTILELLGWCLVVCTFAASSVVVLGVAWVRYCAWSIQRERDWERDRFWEQLAEDMVQRARALASIKPRGIYR